MIGDPEFRAEAAQLKLPLSPKSGEEMQKIVAEALEISPTVKARITDLSKP
jgi:hypothetical protein